MVKEKKEHFCCKFSVCSSCRYCITTGNIGKEGCEQVIMIAEMAEGICLFAFKFGL